MIKFSIIVPVYNADIYLERCLNSIIHQKYSKFELIIINDGSTDNSQSIIDSYSTDCRIISKKIENHGASYARNLGISLATGDYVLFIDSDDYLELNALSILNRHLKRDKLDLIVFSSNIRSKEKVDDWAIWSTSSPRKRIRGDCCKTAMFDYGGSVPYVWNKVYSLNLLNNNSIRFPPFILGEDQSFLFNVFQNCTDVLFIKDRLYSYSWGRKDSIMSQYKNDPSKTTAQHLRLIKSVLSTSLKNNVYSGEYDRVLQWGISLLFHNCLKKLNRNDAVPIAKDLMSFLSIININKLVNLDKWDKDNVISYNIIEALSNYDENVDVTSIIYESDSKYLINQINSSLAQRYINHEVIIITFSNNFDLFIRNNYNDKKIKRIYLPNVSFDYAKLVGIYVSSGKFIRIADYKQPVVEDWVLSDLITESKKYESAKIICGVCLPEDSKLNILEGKSKLIDYAEWQDNFDTGYTLLSTELLNENESLLLSKKIQSELYYSCFNKDMLIVNKKVFWTQSIKHSLKISEDYQSFDLFYSHIIDFLKVLRKNNYLKYEKNVIDALINEQFIDISAVDTLNNTNFDYIKNLIMLYPSLLHLSESGVNVEYLLNPVTKIIETLETKLLEEGKGN